MKISDTRSGVHLFVDLWLLASTVIYSLHWVPLIPSAFVWNPHVPVVLILGTAAFAVLIYPESAGRNLLTTFGFACLAVVLLTVLSTLGLPLWFIAETLPPAVVIAPGFALLAGLTASTCVLLRRITLRTAIRVGVRVVLAIPLVVLAWRLLFGPSGGLDAWRLGSPVLDGFAYATLYIAGRWVKNALNPSSASGSPSEDGAC